MTVPLNIDYGSFCESAPAPISDREKRACFGRGCDVDRCFHSLDLVRRGPVAETRPTGQVTAIMILLPWRVRGGSAWQSPSIFETDLNQAQRGSPGYVTGLGGGHKVCP